MSLTYKNVSTLKCAVLTKNVTKMISINNNKHDLKKKKKSNQQLWELFWEQRNRTRTSKFLTNSLDALSPEGGRKG